MKRIKKEMCMVYIKDHYRSNLIVLSILSVFAVIAVGFFTKNVIVAAIVAALAFVTMFFIIKTTTKKVENVNLNDFYLVEDVLVDCQKRISTKASGGSLAALSLLLYTVAASEVLMLLVTLLAHVKWQLLLVICL